MGAQLRSAVIAVWLILSLAGLAAITAPFVLSEDSLLGLGRGLQSGPHDSERCALCGMTRAFAAISRGELGRARTLNGGSVALYGVLAGNVFAAGAYLVVRAVRSRRERQ